MTRKAVVRRRTAANHKHNKRLRDLANVEIDERSKAYDDYKKYLAEAWKEDPEFGNVMNLALVVGKTRPLKNYLLSNKPLSQLSRRALVAFINSLEKRISLMEKHPGRPRRTPDKVSAAERAERKAAWFVAIAKKTWCKNNGRERVPAGEASKMITAAINVAASAFGVSTSQISEDNIRSALKTGRVVVRY